VIYVACSSNIFFLSFLAFQWPCPLGEANVEKHADPRKKNRNSRKSRETSRNLLEELLRFRKEENLHGHCESWYEQCPKNSFKRLYTLKVLLVLVKKALVSKEFWSEFHGGIYWTDTKPKKQKLHLHLCAFLIYLESVSCVYAFLLFQSEYLCFARCGLYMNLILFNFKTHIYLNVVVHIALLIWLYLSHQEN